jgi:transposase-like protein
MVIETGKPIAEVARDLGIHDGTLGNWVTAFRRENPEPDESVSPVERARVRDMEAEIRRLRMENESLSHRCSTSLSFAGRRMPTRSRCIALATPTAAAAMDMPVAPGRRVQVSVPVDASARALQEHA